MNRSTDIVEIFADVIASIPRDLEVTFTDTKGRQTTTACPPINYVFGSGKYVKSRLDELSKSASGSASKLPMIALFTPIEERRDSDEYFSKASVNLIIACRTSRQWSNEQRLQVSFRNVLRPIYRRLIERLEMDSRLEFGYEGVISHRYIENYSYGKYGALTSNGEAVSEPIDAIDIRGLELEVKNLNCR